MTLADMDEIPNGIIRYVILVVYEATPNSFIIITQHGLFDH